MKILLSLIMSITTIGAGNGIKVSNQKLNRQRRMICLSSPAALGLCYEAFEQIRKHTKKLAEEIPPTYTKNERDEIYDKYGTSGP